MNQAMNLVSESLCTPAFVAQALGLSLPEKDPSTQLIPWTRITTDSRKIVPGCLFIALLGEKFDGHQFIAAAIQQGARGIVCQKDFLTLSIPSGIFLFPVENTVQAYRAIASAWRQTFSIPVISVAGSVGKTTTKEILTAILKGKWPQTLKTQGSQNGYVGIPMTLLELRADHQAAVIEIGIDEPGAMQQHLELVRPTASILTAIGPEHLEKLGNLQTVAHEESIALRWTAEAQPEKNLIAIHLDDPWIQPLWETLSSGKKIGYTLDPSLKSWAQKLSPNAFGLFLGSYLEDETLQVDGPGFHAETFNLPLPGRHNAQNCLGAIALAAGLGLTPQEIRQGLQTFQGAEGRSELKTLPGPTPVLCDYYNAQPASMAAGLDLLNRMAQPQRLTRWACLADMLEMGREEEQLHRDLAEKIISQKVENVLLYGTRMLFLEDELKKRGFQGFVQSFPNQQALAETLLQRIQPGDAVLIKGSRGMKMEEVWKRLTSQALVLKPNSKNLAIAAEAIQRNEVVGMPTETVYGLAGNAWSVEAVTRIFETKERPTFDPLIVHVCPADEIEQVADLERLNLVDGKSLSPLARTRADLLIKKFWPGPLTLVLPKAPQVPDLVTSGLPSVAIRMPRHPVAQAFIAQCKTPLAAPSANRFGRISPTTSSAVMTELGDRIRFILEGGPCEIGLESTVLMIENNGDIRLLRPGGVSRESIESALQSTGLIELTRVQPTTDPSLKNPPSTASPGMLDSHYAPTKPLFLLPTSVFQIQASTFKPFPTEYALKTVNQVGLLILSGDPDDAAHYFSSLIGCPVIARSLSPSGNLTQAAQNLFSELRSLDQSSVQVIFSEPCLQKEGLGHAIADRLQRASFKKTV